MARTASIVPLQALKGRTSDNVAPIVRRGTSTAQTPKYSKPTTTPAQVGIILSRTKETSILCRACCLSQNSCERSSEHESCTECLSKKIRCLPQREGKRDKTSEDTAQLESAGGRPANVPALAKSKKRKPSDQNSFNALEAVGCPTKKRRGRPPKSRVTARPPPPVAPQGAEETMSLKAGGIGNHSSSNGKIPARLLSENGHARVKKLGEGITNRNPSGSQDSISKARKFVRGPLETEKEATNKLTTTKRPQTQKRSLPRFLGLEEYACSRPCMDVIICHREHVKCSISEGWNGQ
ncbi:hypothetical protein ABW19_dt0202371 [Dactylella cylindrospora]|nr:hypothetical protein ABW19_dt0202371 [Dactylella cylindrospora]